MFRAKQYDQKNRAETARGREGERMYLNPCQACESIHCAQHSKWLNKRFFSGRCFIPILLLYYFCA